MKKLLPAVTALLLALALIFSLASCKKDSTETIANTIDKAMTAFISFDEKTLKKCVESSVMDTLNENLDLIPNGDKIIVALLDGTTYEIGEITIDEDPKGVEKNVSATATAKLTVTSKDLKKKSATYQLKVYAGATKGTIDLTDETYLKEESNRVLKVINSEDVTTTTTSMTLELEKRSGKWVVILSGAPQNAMFGGAGSALNQIISYVARAKNGTFGANANGEASTAA